MNKPHIYLAFTDDWELRGDGSGDIHMLQIEPMRRLLEIYEKHNIHGTFMAEVMQQLTFRKMQDKHPELHKSADSWDEALREAFRRGHDVQLHIHPQWSSAEYVDGAWRLKGDWSLPNYEPAAARSMIAAGKQYLEQLLKPIDPNYTCVAFRSGSSVIAPSDFMLDLLSEFGIAFDISIVGGLRVNTRNLSFDYTDCEEDLTPFYPDMQDARRVSNKVEPIVCVPIFHFFASRTGVIRQLAKRTSKRFRIKDLKTPGMPTTADYSMQQWTEVGRSSLPARVWDKAVKPVLSGKDMTADIGRLDYSLMKEMIASVRKRAADRGVEKIPVVLTNHSKDMTDFKGFDRFLSEISGSDDIEFITLAGLAERLRAGEFEIRMTTHS